MIKKKMLNIFIYICAENTLYIYIYEIFASLHEPLQHDTIEHIYGHYFSLITCTEYS